MYLTFSVCFHETVQELAWSYGCNEDLGPDTTPYRVIIVPDVPEKLVFSIFRDKAAQ